MAPQQSNQNVLALERRLAQLEAENAKLKQVKQNLVKKKEKEDRRPPRVRTGRDDDYDDEDFGSGVGDIRKSVEKVRHKRSEAMSWEYEDCARK